MTARTQFLSKLIGLYCMLVSIPMALHKDATLTMVTALVHDAPVVFVFGLIVTAAGLALILSHNVWSGGIAPVVVTIVGWASLIKGLLFLFFPPPAAVGIVVWGAAYDQYFYVDVIVAFVLGAYLTYSGFRSRPAG